MSSISDVLIKWAPIFWDAGVMEGFLQVMGYGLTKHLVVFVIEIGSILFDGSLLRTCVLLREN